MLLLRAAYKFRDLNKQSQNQLEQFMAADAQNEGANESIEMHNDSETEEQVTEIQDKVGNGQQTDRDYVIEGSVTEYNEDVTKKSDSQIFKKRIEKISTAKRKRKQSQSDANNMVYNCMICDNTYTDKTKYNNHMKIHAKDKPHECEICKKRFSTTPQLSRHMNSHTGNRPYKCQYCEATFGDPSTKIKHERTHTNERPYQCVVCNKAFAYSNVLKVHMTTHTGEKPHACEYCGRSFSLIHHKNAHEKRHTNVNIVLLQNAPDDEYIKEEEEEVIVCKVEEII